MQVNKMRNENCHLVQPSITVVEEEAMKFHTVIM